MSRIFTIIVKAINKYFIINLQFINVTVTKEKYSQLQLQKI